MSEKTIARRSLLKGALLGAAAVPMTALLGRAEAAAGKVDPNRRFILRGLDERQHPSNCLAAIRCGADHDIEHLAEAILGQGVIVEHALKQLTEVEAAVQDSLTVVLEALRTSSASLDQAKRHVGA